MRAFSTSYWATLLSVPGLLAACAVGRSGQVVQVGYCDPPQSYPYNATYRPLPAVELPTDTLLYRQYTRRTVLVANAAGALPQLRELVRLERALRQQPASESQALAVVRQRQQILTRVQLLATAVSSVAAELDCEGERADQVAAYLTKRESQREQRLTVFSIGLGAASGVGTTVFESKAMQYAFGIGGGLLTAGLGILTLTGHQKIEFQHPRNLLTDVWQERDSSAVYPPGVWYMLTNKAFSNTGQTSVGHNTRQRWQRYGQLEAPDSPAGQRQQILLFGEGGIYRAEELTIRANMLNELQSAVRLINQDVQGLLLALLARQE